MPGSILKKQQSFKFNCTEQELGQRLDIFLAAQPELKEKGLSRSQLKQLAEAGLLKINGKVTSKAGYVLKSQDQISLELPADREEQLESFDFELQVLFGHHPGSDDFFGWNAYQSSTDKRLGLLFLAAGGIVGQDAEFDTP
jgi:ribosomal 50S subunit-recycling heat shock protein